MIPVAFHATSPPPTTSKPVLTSVYFQGILLPCPPGLGYCPLNWYILLFSPVCGDPVHASFVYTQDQLLALRPTVVLPAEGALSTEKEKIHTISPICKHG